MRLTGILSIMILFSTCKTNSSSNTSETKIFGNETKYGIEDQTVTFYPTFANFNPATNKWYAKINAWVGRSLLSPQLEQLAAKRFNKAFTKAGIQDYQKPNDYYERVKMFFALPSTHRIIKVNFGTIAKELPPSNDGGIIEGNIVFTAEEVKKLTIDNEGWTKFQATNEEDEVFHGQVQFVKDQGLTVVTDVDDTLRISNVYKGKVAAVKTVLFEVPQLAVGMKNLLTNFSQDLNTQYVYLSGSPLPLFHNIEYLLQTNNQYPRGTYLLRNFANFNPIDFDLETITGIFSSEDHKKSNLKTLFTRYPNRKFILIGDSGELDPEIYAWAVENYFQQIQMVYIRNVTNESLTNKRLNDAYGKNIAKLKLINKDTGTVE